MSKFNSAINSFSSGALGKDLRARFDIPQYASGAEEIINFIPRKTGGVTRRTGTVSRGVFNTGTSINDSTRGGMATIPYRYRNVEFILGVPFIRAYGDSGNKWFKYDNAGTNDNVQVFDYSTEQQIGPMEKSVENVSEIQYAQFGKYLFQINTTGQVVPIVYEYNFGYPAAGGVLADKMTRISWDDFVGTEKPLGMPWLAPNTDVDLKMQTTSIKGSGYEGKLIPLADRVTCTITANTPYFTEDMVGHFIRIHQEVSSIHNEGVAKITAFTDANHVDAVEWVGFSEDSNQWDDWALSVFGGSPLTNSPNNHYPTSVGVYQDRLIFGGGALAPNTVFCSKLGNPRIFMDLKLYQDRTLDGSNYNDDSGMGYYGAIKADDAFSIPITGAEGITVQFIIGSNVLFVGTTNRPYIIRSVGGEGFGPLTSEVVSEKAVSCGSIQPVYTSEGFAYVSENGQDIYLGSYVENSGEFINKNITLLNNGISSWSKNSAYRKWWDYEGVNKHDKAYIRQLVWDKENSQLWVLNSRGHMSSLTLEDGAKTAAWANHWVADGRGANNSSLELPEVTSTFIQSMSRATQNLWLNVMRDSDTVNVYTEHLESIEDISSASQDASLWKPISGLTNLMDLITFEWQPTYHSQEVPLKYWPYSYVFWVRVKKNSTSDDLFDTYKVGVAAIDPVTHTTSLPYSQDTYMLGISYHSILKSMPFKAGDQEKSSVGNAMRVDKAFIMLYKTKYAKVFTEYNEEVILDTSDDNYMHTLTKEVALPHSPDTEGYVGVKVDIPYPCTILGWTLRGVHYE